MTDYANAKTDSKAQQVERMLKGRNGASLAELVEATGWQAHSCRAFLTGLRKKGKVPVRDKRKDGTTFYKLSLTGKMLATVNAETASAKAEA